MGLGLGLGGGEVTSGAMGKCMHTEKTAPSAPDLGVQLDVFDEQRESDEASILHAPHGVGVDLNSHLDVFYAILRQVADTPQEIPFLSILQHLLSVDPKEAVSDIIWDTAETLVHRATLLDNRQDASKLLRSPSLQSKLCSHCNCHPHRTPDKEKDSSCGSRKQSLISASGVGIPPPPPPPTNGAATPPPPPFPPAVPAPPCPPAAPPQPSRNGAPPPPCPPPPVAQEMSRSTPSGSSPEPPDSSNQRLLPQQEIPTPKAKMKTINWNKIPNNKVVGKHNVWALVARSHQGSPMAELDWAEMEGLFCQQAPPVPTATVPYRAARETPDSDRRRKESSEIVLLDGKRSLNVNIFLKQFRSSNEDIIQLIRDGAHDDIGAEKLRGLLKILPEVDELEMLRAFDGDASKLGNAEKFLLQLIKVPNYKLRIESMLLKEEFASNMSYLEPSINSMIVAGEDLMTNKPLQEVLYMVVRVGNFLNSGGYAGNAAGVKLSSLQKLTDIRANKPGMHLIHYVAMQAEKKRKDLLRFTDDLTALEDATKTTVEQIQNDINALDVRIKKIKKQVELQSTDSDIKSQMAEFLQMAEREVLGLQKDMEELESLRRSLADFFCEDVASFKLEECLRIFQGFCVKFRQAVVENERRRIQEEQATARRRQREEQLAAKRRHLSGHLGSGSTESESQLVDNLLYDIRSGFQQKKGLERDLKVRSMASEEEVSIPGSPMMQRRRLGSFSGQSPDQPPGSGKDDTYSPDVTPTGSLRRRRSRVPSEEDDSNLMDFLRASGQDASRERKSWGSLDRSWARRARGGSGRRRPELLSADFGGDRERPTSPTPTPTPQLPPLEQEEKPRAWRQKIEAWLQENEKEERDSEDLRRRSRRLQNNRRSLEADSESDGRSGGLDTLPEGKLADSQSPSPQTAPSSTSQFGPGVQESLSNPQYKRVYPDWKPTIDKTDVVGTMEAIAEAQPPLKDKSSWRKSNLNVPNTSEETELEVRRLRRMRSRGNMDSSSTSNTLQAIKEEVKRKNVPTVTEPEPTLLDKSKLRVDSGVVSAPGSPLLSRSQILNKYRNTVDVTEDFFKSLVGRNDEKERDKDDDQLPPSVPRRLRKPPSGENDIVSDRIEIDSDNIETPPATRKVFYGLQQHNRRQTPRRSASKERVLSAESFTKMISPDGQIKGQDEEEMGDGQFERFSSARRTRRYKKSQDSDKEDQPPLRREDSCDEAQSKLETSSSQLIPEKQILRPNTQQAHSSVISAAQELTHPLTEESQKRLKKWQDRLNHRPSPEKETGRDKVADDSDGVTQEALADISKSSKELQNLDVTSRAGRSSSRFLTGIDRNDVLLALRNRPNESKVTPRDRVRSMIEPSQVHEALKQSRGGGELTPTVPRVPKGPSACSQYLLHGSPAVHTAKTRQSNELIPEIRVQASTPAGHGKLRSEHDLLDEGFEETQSLVSETPSQGTSSDVVDSPARKKTAPLTRADSSGSGETSSSTNLATQASMNGLSSMPVKLPENSDISTVRQKLERSNSVKAAFGSRAETGRSGSTVVPRRSPSLRQGNPQNSQPISTRQNNRNSSVERSNSRSSLRGSRTSLIADNHCGSPLKKPTVERSNSRTSLRSSRSSLASATSVNTVRNITSPVPKSSSHSNGGRLTGYTSAIKSLTSNLRRSNPDSNNSTSKDLNKVGLNRLSSTTKRPLAPVQLKDPKTAVPASRSSSSGSSIGATIQRPRVTSGLGTSFKENSRSGIPASRSSSSGSSVGTSPKRVSTLNKVTLKPVSTSGLRFMRPTAASVAKDIPGNVTKPRPGLRSVFK
ncbi:formin-J isoform X3 [Thrips palmi]|uniref:Formin-J isoform X3 n=1 Tax=Thrips palmi TaxID=161013 RepID=A0A6P8ZVC3_THRPL|nr:formin-J isoform X3 [Thrips palmi]